MFRRSVSKIKTFLQQSRVSQISRRVKLSKLTYLSYEKIYNLEKCIKEVERKAVAGIFVEAGVALGGSAIIIASLMSKNRGFHGYDVFEMIPSPSEKDDENAKARYEVIKNGRSKGINGDIYYGYMDNLYNKVIDNFKLFGIQVDGKYISLHQGLFEDTMVFEKKEKIAFAHLDCDWYEPVQLCLKRIYPVWSDGGYIIFDDYHDYGGCKKAVDEFLNNHNDIKIVTSDSNLVLMRKAL